MILCCGKCTVCLKRFCSLPEFPIRCARCGFEDAAARTAFDRGDSVEVERIVNEAMLAWRNMEDAHKLV